MRRLAAAASLVLALAAPAAASAGTVTVDSNGATFTADAGVANDVTLTIAPGTFTVTDTGDTITYNPLLETKCDGTGTTTVTCTDSAVTHASVNLGDLSDHFHGSGTARIQVEGSDGDDEIVATPFAPGHEQVAAFVEGGLGNDTLTTGDGNDNVEDDEGGTDTIKTGAGDDFGEGGPGDNDRVDLGPGNDDTSLDATDGVGDVLDGGPGRDEVNVAAGAVPPPPLEFSLDLTAGAFSAIGSGSASVIGFEDAGVSQSVRSTVTGTTGANVFEMDKGDDTVNPLDGSDFLLLLEGADHAVTRDGFADFVRCGPGADAAEVDQLDVALDCETVTTANVRPASADRVPPACTLTGVRARVTRARLLKRGVSATIGCDTAAGLETRLVAVTRSTRRGVSAARAGDLVLADTLAAPQAGPRGLRLRVPRRLRGAIWTGARLRLTIEARDEFGNVRELSRRIKVT